MAKGKCRPSPIETAYLGYRFRSRLEARWAVFFETIGIRWRYENEGFTLAEGVNYLPDFYLPDFDIYLEMKPDLPYEDVSADGEVLLVIRDQKVTPLGKFLLASQEFASTTQDGMAVRGFYMVCGTPGVPRLEECAGRWKLRDGAVFLALSLLETGPIMAMEAISESADGDLDIWPFYINGVPEKGATANLQNPLFPTGTMSRHYLGNGRSYLSERLRAAYKAARSARFEHGESG